MIDAQRQLLREIDAGQTEEPARLAPKNILAADFTFFTFVVDMSENSDKPKLRRPGF